MNNWFGLKPPAASPAAWGARAIIKRPRFNDSDFFDTLPDRQQMSGEGHYRKVLKDALNNGVLRHCQDMYRSLLRAGHIDLEEPGEVTLYADPLIKVTANTNGSHGYLYIVAYIKPQPDPSTLKWSGDTLPQLGDKVKATGMWCIDEREAATVVGYYAEHDHLFLVCDVCWTAEGVEQNVKENERYLRNGEPRRDRWGLLMGREFELVEEAA